MITDEARAELARRLEVLDGDLVGAKRRRLETRLTRLTQLFGWGELSGEEYRRQMLLGTGVRPGAPYPRRLPEEQASRRRATSHLDRSSSA